MGHRCKTMRDKSMKFENEEKFRRWIVAELPTFLNESWIVIFGKNISDIVLCWNNIDNPLLLFIEVKYHKSSHGRIGFGDGKGLGYQTELLLKSPAYTERYMRWIIGDQDSCKCLLFENNDVRENCAGEIKTGKQNNFTNGLFKKNASICFDLPDSPRRIAEWAKSVVSTT